MQVMKMPPPLFVPRRIVRLVFAFVAAWSALAHEGSHDTPLLPADPIAPGAFVSNFRLTDQVGATHELFYESRARAILLVFTSRSGTRASQTASALAAVRARFAEGDLTIWQIDSDFGADRAAVAAEQAQLGSSVPVLMDAAQLVATEYGATRQLEAFVIRTKNWTLSYRGPLDNADPASTAVASQTYAADAISAVLAGGAVAAPLVALPGNAALLDLPPRLVPDYASDVAPIVQRSCVQCHSPGNIAPFAFSGYADLQLRAAQIRGDLLTRRMTPWHADAQFGVFAHNTALPTAEIATLFAWARANAPRGSGADPLAAAPPAAAPDWELGTPDLIVSIPRQSLPATGVIDYKYLTVAVPLAADRWLRAAVVKPGNNAVVHHALVFEGTLLDVIGNAGGLGGFFAGYVPGLQQNGFPEGSGKLLKRGSFVTFQMHYTTSGRAETDQTQLGLYFAATPPDRALLTRSAYTTAIAVPPGMKDYTREATYQPSATKDVMLYELNPHMHYRGKRFKYEALYPDGTSEVLLNVPQYDFHWQSQYRLTQPKRLPAGTVIRASGAFDNSAENRDNPNPAAAVTFGEQTADEMFVGYINYAELADRAGMPPVFSGNLSARAQVGAPFTLEVAARNGVTRYHADALPAGLSLNAATGVLAGTPENAGRRAIVIYADNAAGSAAVVIDLAIAPAMTTPAIIAGPTSHAVAAGEGVSLVVTASGGTPLSYQWYLNGQPLLNSTAPTLTLPSIAAADAGQYSVRIANALGAVTSRSAVIGVASTAKIFGAGSEVGSDIPHPKGNIYDQILLQGPAATVTADSGQVVRISFVDLNDDIVQIEFAGAGSLTLTLDNASGPARPVNYVQDVAYVKGHARIVITGADETTNLSVFSVGRGNAVNAALFKSDVVYDGLADLASIAISSANGKFGGLRAANANFFATRGLTGIYAPGVQFLGPVFAGDIGASDAAVPALLLGSGTDVRITGGDLFQANGQPVQVSGIMQLKFTAGSTSHDGTLAPQKNRARLEQDGADVTAQIVVNPGP